MRIPKNTLWVLVSTDKYELPAIVAGSQKELAQRIGRNKSTIATCFRSKCRIAWGGIFYRIEKVKCDLSDIDDLDYLEGDEV